MSLPPSKTEYRQQALARLRAVPEATLRAVAEEAVGALRDWPVEHNACVAIFIPMRGEVPVFDVLKSHGFRIALPCIDTSNAPLVFREFKPGDALVSGLHGTRQPETSRPVCVPNAVLVPLLAFDHTGVRLGRGAGYYDRTLQALRGAGPCIALGVAASAQEMPSLPREAHDALLDGVITERGLRRF